MFARALLAFLALPGTVAFLVPLFLFRPALGWPSFRLIALLPLGVGSCLLLWCVRDFYVTGKGTLAPWSPPRNLVIVGAYRWSRNPMYLAVFLILLGWAVGFGTRGLWIYAVGMLLVFHLRVVGFEEPWLARQHGEAWLRYKAQVPRWLGSRNPGSLPA
ncbi:MAG TPA: isoprenylcysteine carboxylmethyltransferase family protein [Gemmatimonadales bacterium]|jgi:protein-S-isoprenylcysteine O-methyltransferase Ste14|nr:isoprenylcysteine carboxylmethyltransferase family protein [Gemmatimonadales bacterium]